MLLEDDILNGIRADVETSRREGALRSGSLQNPDEFSKTDQLAQKLDVPRETVQGNLPKYLQKEKEETLLLEDFTDTPKLGKFLSNPDNAAQAHDDIESLSGLERVLKGGGGIPVSTQISDVARAMSGEIVSAFGRMGTGAATLDKAVVAETMGWLESAGLIRAIEEGKDIDKLIEENIEKLPIASALEAVGEPIIEVGESIKPPHERETKITQVAEGVGQVIEQVGVAVATGGSGSLVSVFNLLGMGALQQKEALERQGLKITDDPIAVISGAAVTGVTEKWGIDRHFDKVPEVFKGRVSNWLADKIAAGGKEAIQEMVEGTAHNLIEQYRYNPDAEIFEGVTEEGEIAGYVGIVARVLTSSLMPGRIRPSVERETNNQINSIGEQGVLEEVTNLAQESKLNPRNNQLFQQYVNDLDSETNVHIPADVMAEFYDGENTDVIKQIKEAGVLGGDVVIPIDLYASEVAKQSNIKEIRDHARLSEDSLSKSELEKIDVKKDIGEIFDNLQGEQELVSEAVTIYESVEEQLIESGRIAPQNAKYAAALFPGFAASKAKERGKSPQEIYDMMGLTIVPEDVGVETDVLEQNAATFKGMTKDEFLGSPTITSAKNAAMLRPRDITGIVTSEPFLDDKYQAVYSNDGAAVYDGDDLIASYNHGKNIVVDKKYRKKGIGEELVYQWRTRFPAPAKAEERTRVSQKIQEKVWERIRRENQELLAQESAAETARKEQLKAIEVKTIETIEETGEQVEITEKADVAYQREQQRSESFQNMINCLRG